MAGFAPYEPETDPGAIRERAAELMGLAGRITGHGVDLESTANAGSMEFSAMIAGPIQATAMDNVEAWSAAVTATTFGANVTQKWATDIEEYKEKIEALKEEWSIAVAHRFGADPDSDDFEDEYDEKRAETLALLNERAKAAKDDFEEAAESRKSALESGPTKENVSELVDAGILGWFFAYNLWGEKAGTPPRDLQEEYANRAHEYMNGGEDGVLDDDDLRELNAIMTLFGAYGHFNKHLMEQTGAKGLVDFMVSLADNDVNENLSLRAQELLASSLARTTDPLSSSWMGNGWIQDIMDVGADFVLIDGDTRDIVGYEVLAPLFTKGSHPFSVEFLVPVADHMFRIINSNPNAFNYGDGIERFDVTGELGSTPIDAMMIALNNRPAAAAIVFSQGVRYEELTDGFLFASAPGRAGGALVNDDSYLSAASNNVALLFDKAKDAKINVDLYGVALQAAVTGVDGNADLTSGDVSLNPYSADMARVVERIIHHLGENTAYVNSGTFEPMKDSLTNITIVYMRDIHNTFDPATIGDTDAAWYIPGHGANGVKVDLNLDYLQQFLTAMGKDTETGVHLTLASQALFQESLIHAAAFGVDDFGGVSRGHASVTGALAVAGFNEYISDAANEGKIYDMAAGLVKTYIGIATGGITTSTTFEKLGMSLVGGGVNSSIDKFTKTLTDSIMAEAVHNAANDKHAASTAMAEVVKTVTAKYSLAADRVGDELAAELGREATKSEVRDVLLSLSEEELQEYWDEASEDERVDHTSDAVNAGNSATDTFDRVFDEIQGRGK